MNRKIVIIMLITGLISIVLAFNKITHKTPHTSSRKTVKIGILQTASHPALDSARKGFIDTIKKELGDDIECITQNAQGSIIAAHSIAQRYHLDESIDAIYAIATPALQAIASLEKKKPIFISAVSNPQDCVIIEEKTNICGTTDMVDITQTVSAIKAIKPTIATVGLVYNIAEKNSVTQIALLEKELHKNAIKTIHIAVVTEADIAQAVTSAIIKADALLIPTDNLIASAMPLISYLALSAKKPIIACHNQAVEQGALMARGVNYYESGRQTAQAALDVLYHGKKAYEVGIIPTKSDTIMINKDILEELSITIGKISDTIMYTHLN